MRSFTLLLLRGMAFVQIDNVERRSSQAAAQLLGELSCSLQRCTLAVLKPLAGM